MIVVISSTTQPQMIKSNTLHVQILHIKYLDALNANAVLLFTSSFALNLINTKYVVCHCGKNLYIYSVSHVQDR